MKHNRPYCARPLSSSIARFCSVLSVVAASVVPHAQAANDLYWDTNGVLADTGATSGIWGLNNFWNTDSTGGAGTFSLTTTSINDLHFFAGTGATAGTVSVYGPVSANGITFEENVATTLLGRNNGPLVTLGAGGINVMAGDNAANLVAVPLSLTSSAAFTNGGTGLLSVSGAVGLATGAGLTISGPGATTVSGVISGGAAFGSVGLTINGGAVATLSNTGNTFRGDIAIDGAGSALNYTGTSTTTTSQLGLGNGLGYKKVLLSNGGAFRLSAQDFNDNIPTLTNVAAGVVFNVGSGGGIFDVTASRTLTIDDGNVNASTATNAAQLQGSGTITKMGLGTLSLGTGTSNYSGFTGAIVVAEGVLQTGAVSTNPFGSTTAGTTVQSGASLSVGAVSIGSEPLSLVGSGFGGRGALYATAAGGAVTGPITLTGDTSFGATVAAAGLTISGVVSGNFNITKVGAGSVGFNQTNLGTGTLTVAEGNLNVNGLAGRFSNTPSVAVNGSGTLNIGDVTAANGVADRINPNATISLGNGGGNIVVLRGSTVANSQSFASLSVGSGLSSITNNGTTGGAPTLTFSGANPYSRSVGGILNITNANLTTTFTNAPSGAGNVTGGATPILVGGVLNGDNFIAAGAGSVAATTYTANTWGSGINTLVTGAGAPASDSTTQSLAFSTGANTVTLTGTNTIESGGILVQTAATSGTITGGNLQAPAGRDLWVFMNGKPLTIASSILNNGGSSLTVGGTAAATSILTLTGSNTYTGSTLVNFNSTLTLSNPAANNTTIVGNVTIGSHNTATVLLGASDQIADTSAITFNSGTVGGQSAFFHLNGFNETVASIATVPNPLGSASVIANNAGAGASILTVNGSSTTTYDGIIRNGAVGTVGLTLAGTTNLTLTNQAVAANINYTGPTTIGAGTTLNMFDGNGATIASFASPITNSGSLILNNVNVLNNVVAVNRTLAQPISGGGNVTLNNNNSSITLSGVLSIGGTTTVNTGTLIVGNAAAGTITGKITGSGSISMTGAGGVTVSNAANDYAGTTTIGTGPLNFLNHSLPATSAVTINATGTLGIFDEGTGNNGTIAYGNNVTVTSATGTINVGNNGLGNTGNTVAFGALTPTVAANTTALTGANGYKVSFTNLVMPGGTGQTTTLNPTTTSVSILGDVTNSMSNYGTGNFDTLALDGTSTGNSIGGSLSDAIGGSFVPLLGGYTRLIKQNSSTWTVNGANNSYTGITQVLGGTLIVGSNNFIPLANLQGINVTNGVASSTAVFDLAGFNQTLNTAGGTGTAINFGGGAATSAASIIGTGSTLTINGNVNYTATNNPLGATISTTTLDLGGGNRTFNVGDSTTAAIDLTVSSAVQNGTLVKTGAGTLQLTQVPTASVVLNQGVLDLNANTITNFTTNGGGTVQNGTISGASFLKQGPGTLTLAAATTGVSAVGISQGLLGMTANPGAVSTINVNFAGAGMPASNAFSSSAALTLGGSATNLVAGGGILLTGAASGSNSQTFASTLIDAGANTAGGVIGAGGTVALNLGTVTRNAGGTVDFTIPAGTQSATNGIIVGGTPTAATLVTDANGTAYATAGGNDWAANSTVSANNIVAANVAGAASVSIYTAATNAATFAGNADVTATLTANPGVTVNSIRMNAGTSLVTTLSGANTITTGGILFGNGITTAATITGGTIQPGAGNELVIISNAAGKTANVNSQIIDNGANPVTVTLRGSNTTGGTTGAIIALGANNLYSGPTYITGGRAQVTVAGVTTPFGTGTNAIVYIDGNADGQFFTAQNTTIANPFVVIGTGFNEAGTRRGVIRLDSSATNTPTLSGPITLMGDSTFGNNAAITGAGASVISGNIGTSSAAGSTSFTLNKVLTGVLKLSGTNSQTNTLLTAGALNVNADAALGISGAPITFNGGTLQYQNSFAIATARPVVLTGAGTIDTGLLGSTSTTLSNVISGPGAFTKSYATQNLNTAPLILSGDNTFTGGVTATSGYLVATNSNSFGLGAKTVTAATNTSTSSIHLDPSQGSTPSVGIDFPANMTFATSNDGVPAGTNFFALKSDGTIVNDSGNNIIRGPVNLTSGGGGAIFASNSGTITFAGPVSTIQAGRDLKIRGDGNGVISGVISNGTTVQLPIARDLGSGTWTLSGANTYGGATTISSGTLKITHPSALGFGGNAAVATLAVTSNQGTTVNAGGVLDLSGTAGVNELITLNGTGIGSTGALINSAAGTTATIEGNIASALVTTPGNSVAGGAAVTVTGGGGTGATATANLGVTTTSYTITNAGAGYTSVPTVAITAGGGAGATATVTLSGGTTGTVTGLTITNAGTGFTGGATFALTGGAPTTAAVLTGANLFQVNHVNISNPGAGYTSVPTITLGNSAITVQRSAVALASDSTVGGVGDITIGGVVSGTAALTKVGNGKLTLNGANTFANGVALNGGVIIANNATALGAGTTTVAPTTTLISGAGLTNPITLNGGTLGARATSALTNTLTVTANSTVTFADPLNTASENDITVSGTLAGSGNINVVAGTNTATTTDGGVGFRVIGTAASTYSGTITVGNEAKFEARTTVAGPFSPIGTGKVILAGGTYGPALAGTYSSTIFRNNSAGNTTFGNDVELTGTGLAVINSPGSAPVGSITTLGNLKLGANQILGPNRNAGNSQVLAFTSVTLTGGNATFAPNTLNAGYTGSVDLTLGAIGESAPSGIIMDGQATLTLGAANNYSGSTTIQRGTTKLGAAGALPATTALVVTGGTLDFNNGGTSNSQTVASLAGTGGIITNSDITERGMTVNETSGSTEYSGVISGALAVTKQGAGTLILSGLDPYTGATTVDAAGGTLIVNGTLSGSAVTVNGGILGGSGIITQSVTVNTGGTLAPGNSPGILSTGSLNLASGSTFAVELNGATVGTGYDQVNVTGGITLAGSLTLSLGYAPAASDVFWIGLNDGADSVSGAFSNVPVTDIGNNAGIINVSGTDYTVFYSADFGTGAITGGNDILVVPEPGSAALLLGGLALLAGRRRRTA